MSDRVDATVLRLYAAIREHDPQAEYGIVANVAERDRSLRMGSKAWLIGGAGGEGLCRFEWWARTRGGRMVRTWKPTTRFANFRPAWIPDHLRDRFGALYVAGTREGMQGIADHLNEHYAHIEGEG
jgi:hypothetical protein